MGLFMRISSKISLLLSPSVGKFVVTVNVCVPGADKSAVAVNV